MDGHSVTVGDATFQQVNGESHHDLVEAVRQKMWGSVRELLEADIDATTRSWAVQEAITHASDGQLLYILPHCTDDQVDKGVREAVRRDMWGTVGELMARIKTDKICRWVVEEAAKRAMDEQLVSIIQYCTDDQVDAVFREAVDRHQWQSVLYLLGRGVTDTQIQWAVEEASKQAEDDELCPLLLHCTDDQLNSVVTQLVTQRRWECVLNLLQRGLPDSLCELILREASQHAAEYQLLSLLSFCPDSQYDCVLMQIIQRGCWRAVDQLLQRSVDDQRIRSAIEKSTEPWDEDEFDTAVRVALKYEAWTFISHALDQQRDISESTCKLIVQNMNENNRENSDVTVAEEDSVVNQATSSLCIEKMQPVSSDHRSLLTSAVLKLAVSKHMWPTVLQLLGGSKCAFAVEEAMKHADDDVLEQILPHCTDDQVESALHVAVSRRLWFAVSELLQRPVSDTKRAWAVEEARTNADDSHLEAILLHCTDDQLGLVFDTAVCRQLWSVIGQLSLRPVDNIRLAWAVKEAVQHADDFHLAVILPHCPDDQLDSVLMVTVKRGLWDCGESLMIRRRDRFQRGRLNHISDDQGLRIINSMTDDRSQEHHTLFAVLLEAVTRQLWDVVLTMARILPLQQRKWVVVQASILAHEEILKQLITVYPIDISDVPDPVLQNLISRGLWSIVISLITRLSGFPIRIRLLSHTDTALTSTQRIRILEEASKRASDDDLEFFVSRLCTRDCVGVVFPHLLERQQWRALSIILDLLTRTQAEQVLKEVGEHADEPTLNVFLGCCPDELFDYAFTLAVKRGFWNTVTHYMQLGQGFGFTSMSMRQRPSEKVRKLAVEEAMKRAGDNVFASIATCCTDDQLESVFAEVVTRRLWDAADQLMTRGIKTEQVTWTVIEASKFADEKFTLKLIRNSHSLTEINQIFLQAVIRGMWKVVAELLQRSPSIPDTERRWAVEEAMERELADEPTLNVFLGCCPDELFDYAFTLAVKRGFWNTVTHYMQLGQGFGFTSMSMRQRPSEKVRKLAVEEAMKRAGDNVFASIATCCTDDQLESVFAEVVTRRLWDAADQLMTRGIKTEQVTWTVIEASKFADEKFTLKLIRNSHSLTEINQIFPQAVIRGMWKVVAELLQRSPSIPDTERRWAVEEAMEREHANEPTLNVFLDCCPDELFDYAFTLAVKRGFWNTVTHYMQLGQGFGFTSTSMRQRPSEKVRKLAVEEAMKRAGDNVFASIATCCTDDQLESVFAEVVTRRLWDAADEKFTLKLIRNSHSLTEINQIFPQAVIRGMWKVVAELLQRSPSIPDTERRWAVEKAMERADDEGFSTIACLCHDDQLESVFCKVVTRRLWDAADRLLSRGIKTEQVKWAVTEASKYADEKFTLKLIRRHCRLMEINPVLPQAVRRGMWKVVVELLKRNPSIPDTERRRAVEEALRNAKDKHINTILCYCANDQLEVAVREAVKRRIWHCVVTLFVRGLTDELQEWVLGKVVKHLKIDQVLLIVPHCADSVLDFLLTKLVTRRLWRGVLDLLRRTTTLSKQRWAISEASKYAPEDELLGLIAYSTDGQLDSVLTKTVQRRMWRCVGEVLERGVSSARRKWALEETSKKAPENHLTSLLQYVTDDHLLMVLTEVVGRRMWGCVVEILERGVDVTQQEWVLAEASEHASETQLFPLLKYVTDAQVYPVLTTAVAKHMWSCVTELLKREVEAEHRKWAVEEASKNASEESLLALLPHCPDDELDSVFKETVKRRQWRVVKKLLDGPREGRRRVSLQETTQEMKLNYDKELRNVMQENDWTTVSFMLEFFTVSASLRRQAVDEVCNTARYHLYARCNDNDFMSIIQHCDHTQLMTVLHAAVKRNLTHTACDMLTRLGQHGEPRSLTENGRAILLAVMDIKNGRQKLVAECMKLGITTGESEDTHRSRLLGSYNVDILRKDSPFTRAVLDNNIHIVRMLYECGVCSNTDIQKLCKVFAVWEVQSKLFQATFQNMSMFLKDKASTPRSLVSMCRLVISRHLGVGCIRQERVKQLPLPEPLRDYVVFPNIEGLAADDVTDDDARPDGDVIKAALLDAQTKLASIRTYD